MHIPKRHIPDQDHHKQDQDRQHQLQGCPHWVTGLACLLDIVLAQLFEDVLNLGFTLEQPPGDHVEHVVRAVQQDDLIVLLPSGSRDKPSVHSRHLGHGSVTWVGGCPRHKLAERRGDGFSTRRYFRQLRDGRESAIIYTVTVEKSIHR